MARLIGLLLKKYPRLTGAIAISCPMCPARVTLAHVNAGEWFWLLFLACSAVQGVIYLAVFMRLVRYREPWPPEVVEEALPPEKISLVICARNEATNLRNNLPRLLAQQYPNWELVVVDDGSEDGSGEWLRVQAEAQRVVGAMPEFRVLHVTEEQKRGPGKKGALAIGIEQSTGDLLVLSDADCYPSSDQWLQHMASRFKPETDFVLGYGAYAVRSGWLNRVIQFETLHTVLQYASWTLAGMPYMGVGRNLAYRRSVYMNNGGFSRHADWPSGDDDLMVNQNARSGRVALCLHPDAWTISEPSLTWADWRRQKQRHLSTGVFYRPLHKVVLALYAMSHFGWYASFFACVAAFGSIPLLFVVLILRLALVNGVYYHLSKRFNRPYLWHFSTIFDFLTVVYYTRFVTSTRVSKPPTWR